MFNFYREFTKDLERRLNSRAYDIKPQTVVSNDVQMVLDIERPYYKDITWFANFNAAHAPVTAPNINGYFYGQTPVVYTGSVVTPLTAPATAEATTINKPTYIASTDNISSIEVLDVKYDVRLFNVGPNPTTANHSIDFAITKFGSTFNFQFADFSAATLPAPIPAGGSQDLRNTLVTQRNNGAVCPIIWTNERVGGQPAAPLPNRAENQLTWFVRHVFDTLTESETVTFECYIALKCRVYYQTPFNSVQISQPLTAV